MKFIQLIWTFPYLFTILGCNSSEKCNSCSIYWMSGGQGSTSICQVKRQHILGSFCNFWTSWGAFSFESFIDNNLNRQTDTGHSFSSYWSQKLDKKLQQKLFKKLNSFLFTQNQIKHAMSKVLTPFGLIYCREKQKKMTFLKI